MLQSENVISGARMCLILLSLVQLLISLHQVS